MLVIMNTNHGSGKLFQVQTGHKIHWKVKTNGRFHLMTYTGSLEWERLWVDIHMACRSPISKLTLAHTLAAPDT